MKSSGLNTATDLFTYYVQVCKPLHGNVERTQGPLLLRCILPGILMVGIHGSSDISPKGHGVIREHALHFIKHLMAHVSIFEYPTHNSMNCEIFTQ